ncbi:P-loop NTPase fold protein [Dyadobacter sp. 3J3]|uniref:P-loop NTPase fold protein n=1 Tax=Dyadobacter sp. 3J3 TaxID=2606600 RepID=UPI00135763E9|nr:P-loop NTPase fold protein [Dyadobacter sp. 3J3]
MLKAIKLVLGKFIPSPSFKTISQQKGDINRSLRLIGKKIIVFIDDLDRVSPEEILDVLNLIRNTADFQNTIFLVAMDLDYIKSSLNSQNNLLNVDKYLEKIFQLQFVLSPIMFDTIKLLLEKELDTLLEINKNLGLPPKFSENFKEALSKISFQPDIVNGIPGISSYDRPGILEESLTNIRDIKRFLNSFTMTYKLFIGELDMLDLILLELLKLKFTHFYLQLSKGRFIVFDDVDRGKWKLDDQTFTEYLKRNNDSQLLAKIVTKIYKTPETTGQVLSKIPANKNRNSLIFIDNHKKYFNHDLFGDISINALLEAKTNGLSGLENFFEQIVNVDSNDNYTNEELDFSLQFKIGKFYMYLIGFSNSGEDKIEIIHSIRFIKHLPKFYLPQVLRTEILLLCRQDSYLDITSKLLLNIFEQQDVKLKFKLELDNEMRKNFSILFYDEFWPECCLRCIRSLFANLNINEETDSKLQEEIYVLFIKWLHYFLKYDKLKDGIEMENFKRYFMVNPKILLVGIFDSYNVRENQLSIYPNIINFFQFWDMNKQPIENYRDFLKMHIDDYELARRYYMRIKLYNSLEYADKLEEIQLHVKEYKEAVFKDNLGYLLG